MFCSSLPKPKDPGADLGQSCTVSFFGHDSCRKGFACRASSKDAPKVCEKTREAERLHLLLVSTSDPDSPESPFPIERRVQMIRSHLQSYPYLLNLPCDTIERTPLHLATIKGLDSVVRLLLELGADQQITTTKGETALLFAAGLGFERIVSDLLSACPIVINVQTVAGHSPLMVAVQKNYISIVKQLVENGASVDLQDKKYYTVLSYAIVNSSDEIVFYLLDKKATADDALELAFSKNRLTIVNRLIDTEALKYYIMKSGVTILNTLLSWFAGPMTEEQRTIQEKLFRRKDLLNAQEPEMKNTALHELARKWERDLAKDKVILDQAKRLIEYGADVSILNSEGDIALSLAIESCETDGSLVALLLDAGSDIHLGYLRGPPLQKAKDHPLGPLMVSILQAKTSEERNVFLKQISSNVKWKTLFNRTRENKSRSLGKGSYGFVQRVEKDGKFYAVKRVQLSTNRLNENRNKLRKTKKNSLNRELNALRTLSKNPYVVQLHNYEAQNTRKNGSEGFLIMEELPNGYDLFDAAFEAKKITDSHIKPLVIQLLQGLKSIHDTGYIHLDIKPDNIHWSPDNTIKYLDFGLAQKNPFLRGPSGTPSYITWKTNASGRIYQDKTSDFYSLAKTIEKLVKHISGLSPSTVEWAKLIVAELLTLKDTDSATDVLDKVATLLLKPEL